MGPPPERATILAMRRSSTRAALATTLVALAVGGCRGDKKRSHEEPVADADAPVCAALSREAAMKTALEALLGEYFVMKFAVSFDDHAEIAARARAAGGQAASFSEQPILVDGPNGAFSAVIDGRDDLERLRPYVVEGSFDRPEDEEVALGRELAKELGVSVGDSVELFPASSLLVVKPAAPATPMKARVAALLSFPGEELHHYGERFAFAKVSTAQRLVLGSENNITGVRIYAGGVDAAKPERWLSSDADRQSYRVMSMTELNGASLDWTAAAARAACQDGPPAASPRRAAVSVPHRCEVSTELRGASSVITRLLGALRVVPGRASEFEAAAKRASATSIRRRIDLDATIVTNLTARISSIFSVGAEDESAFEGLVSKGSIRDILDEGKVALGDRLAVRLGVEPGDEVFVRARRSGSDEEPTSFRVRVGALVKLPANAGHLLSDSTAWMSERTMRDQLRLAPDAATSVVAWASDPTAFQEALSNEGFFADSLFRESPMLDLTRLLEESCRARPDR